MIDDLEPLIPEEPVEEEDLGLDEEGHPKKKPKDLIDEDTVSLDDEADDEAEEEPEDDYGDGDDKYE